MAARYKMRETRTYWLRGCPVVMTSHAVEGNKAGRPYLHCVFKNVGHIPIKEFHYHVAYFDTGHRPKIAKFSCRHLHAAYTQTFESNVAVNWSGTRTSYTVTIAPERIIFTNGAQWENEWGASFTRMDVRAAERTYFDPKAYGEPRFSVRTLSFFAAFAAAIGAALWFFLPADYRFLYTLEKSINARYQIMLDEPESSYREQIEVEQDVLKYDGKWFRSDSLKAACTQYIAGLQEQETSLMGEDLPQDDTAWNEGVEKQCQIIKTLQKDGKLHLDSIVYLEYAMKTIEQELIRNIAGIPRMPAIKIKITNSTLLNLNNVQLTIHFFWADRHEQNTLEKNSWRSGEQWDMAIAYPNAAFNSGGEIQVSLDMAYQVSTK